MATLVLSSVGKLLGPVGQIAGTLAGNAIDNALFGPDDIEGARLTELAVSGSSYGTPIARQYGAVRTAGTIIWSTDLKEDSERESHGKGQPKTVQYSYSVSMAVALSSRPIDRVGRIWADGNLLRGVAGDLKSAGTLRVYTGHHDQGRDPLLEAALGAQCPAYRGRAYVVFEDLQLADFGNRIPALSFEVLAGSADELVQGVLDDVQPGVRVDARFPELRGFGHQGGSARDVIALVDRLKPVTPRLDGDRIAIDNLDPDTSGAKVLPAAGRWDDGEFGRQSGRSVVRQSAQVAAISALRYYDQARDYQPSLQHAAPQDRQARAFQFPGVLAARDAATLAASANLRASVRRETMLWRCCELDPAVGPGTLVTVPGDEAVYLVTAWEWREGGIELELVRHRVVSTPYAQADAGLAWTPPDRTAAQTQLRVFEVPSDGLQGGTDRMAFAAADAPAGLWSGCTLHALRDGALTSLGLTSNRRAVTGALDLPLGPSPALRYEPEATATLTLLNSDAVLPSSAVDGLAQGDNRILIGDEVMQYARAISLGDGQWVLIGLLRGRGGTEPAALAGHAAGTAFTLLDNRLVPLGPEALTLSTGSFAALGLWDSEPALAPLENAGQSLRPPSPVHATRRLDGFGHSHLSWIRRARGQWLWPDEADTPLVEEQERYEIGCGPAEAPIASWATSDTTLFLAASELSDLQAVHGPLEFWVRQIGTHGKSAPSAFVTLDS